MRKEILLAIFIGVAVGLAITFGMYSLRTRLFQNQTPGAIEESRQKSLVPTPTPSATLTLQQPEQDFLTDESSVQVVGRALANSHIVILSPLGEYITTADQDGDFAQSVKLDFGGNKLTITSITPEGIQESVIRNVVYSTVDLDAEATASAQPAASPTPKP